MKANVKSSVAREAYDTLFTTLIGAEMSEISLHFFLKFLKTTGGFDSVMDTIGGAQEDRIQGGVQQIVELLVDKYLEKSCIFLNEPIICLKQLSDQVIAISATGKKFCGKFCICAVPLPLQSRIFFDPPLPSPRQQLAMRTSMGSIIKLIVVYRKPFWREFGYSGEIVSVDGPVRLFFDDTQEGGKMPSLVGFFCAKEAREYHGKPEDRKRAVIQQLVQIFGSDAADYVNYIDKDWAEEQWSGGCFYGIMSLGVLSAFGSVLRQPFQRIHFAGTETAVKWAGYFEGAIESGLRAATEIEQRMKQCKL